MFSDELRDEKAEAVKAAVRLLRDVIGLNLNHAALQRWRSGAANAPSEASKIRDHARYGKPVFFEPPIDGH
jgi:hypothetical protein